MKFRLRRPIPWIKIMKITFSQILIALMLSGIAYSGPLKAQDVLDKTVNISLTNTTILDVLNYLQRNNNVKFIYSKNAIDVNQKISANFENQSLKAVLDQLFKNKGIDYEVLKDRIILGKGADKVALDGSPAGSVEKANGRSAALSVSVTGKVVDAQGLPLPGVSIVEKGTQNGITTNTDGSFKINVAGTNSV